MSWESPIDVIYEDVATQFEGEVLKAVQRCEIKVDKEELIKALAYDRKQYEQGYGNGYADGMEAAVRRGRWKPFDLTWGRSVYACTSCGEAFEVPTECGKPMYEFCPLCGAKMDK